jgi:hypothetical protein
MKLPSQTLASASGAVTTIAVPAESWPPEMTTRRVGPLALTTAAAQSVTISTENNQRRLISNLQSDE